MQRAVILVLVFLPVLALAGAPRSVQHGGWTIHWSDAQVHVTQGSTKTVLAQDTKESEETGDDISVLSVVGPWVSVSTSWYYDSGAHPSYGTAWRTFDVSRGGRAVPLQDLFGEQAVFDALMGDGVIQKALKGPKPTSLSQLVSSLDGDCDMDMGPSMLNTWAFHHVKPGKVAVRVGLSHGYEVCRGKFTQLGMYLPIPNHLEGVLSEAAGRGTLMKDLGGK